MSQGAYLSDYDFQNFFVDASTCGQIPPVIHTDLSDPQEVLTNQNIRN